MAVWLNMVGRWLAILLFVTTLNIASCQECIEQLDITFIIDSSISVRENNPADGSFDNWDLIKDFVVRTVSQIAVGPDQIRVAIVHYSTIVHEPQVLTLEAGTNKDDVIQRIRTLEYLGGNTNTSGALAYVTNNIFNGRLGDRNYISDIGILITDGLSNVDQTRTASEAVRAKNRGIDLFTIGVTEYSDEAELTEIASDPTGFYYLHVDFYNQLNAVVDRLLGRICTSRPPPKTPCRNSRIDVGILMDESGSIIDKNPENTHNLYNWDVMKDFVANIIGSLTPVGPNFAKVSVTKFSDRSRIQFYLDTYDNEADMVDAVLQFEHRSGSTNISGALRVLRTQIFDRNRGDREDVQNIGILITDGESTVEQEQVEHEASLLKEMGVRMYGLGITSEVDYAELQTIASEPTEEHLFQTETIQDVKELTEKLVWGVCNDAPTCTGNNCNSPGAGRCRDPGNFRWVHYEDHLLLGHNHARLQSVPTSSQCKSFCLKDPKCRSVDFIEFAAECSISYVRRLDRPMEFVESIDADYYEWICEGEESIDSNSGFNVNPGGYDTSRNGKKGSNSAGRIELSLFFKTIMLLFLTIILY